ncbi:MAG: UDP-N-acetylmuramoyl-tripeptide--D-alanyl-D-alanine ligase [candidate division Zixibacteria bacterium]|nr:UDP-N-acetylmuramoyl-tripeptide--D-alanyl-D-alanine ligase [candidate division Zixibacteria bacterium]
MDSMPINEIIKYADPVEVFSYQNIDVGGVSIDSRTIKPGELFVAVKGERTDGHQYIQQAIENGASAIVVSSDFRADFLKDISINTNIFTVDDTLLFLGDLAASYLEKIECKVIGITGTNGKTSVKDFTIRILSSKYKTSGTIGNLNNRYGLPLSIFSIESGIDAAVFELGMSELGEITRLCEIAKPDIGILNNISPAHLEGLGCIENIIEAKCELLEYIAVNDGKAVINIDDENIAKLPDKIHADYIKIGTGNNADIKITEISFNDGAKASFRINGVPTELNIPGLHNVYNSVMAVAGATVYGMELEEAISILPSLKLPEMRSSVYQINDITIINDSYNANPQSVIEAIRLLDNLDAAKRFVVLGDMLELGELSEKYHREIGIKVRNSKTDYLYIYGEYSKFIGEEAAKSGSDIDVSHYQSHEQVAASLLDNINSGDAILFKGSRGMQLEKAVDLFEQKARGI